ncbi:hypothetical protein GGR50DRAFT_116664 [Xylaria sp. CBS 124048]|nr:hypothetical protein GGR50DRAFT_116664 [Xylaria sp. CBS 124048]
MSSKEDENPEPPAGDATVLSPQADRDLAEATKGTGKYSLEDGVLVMPSEDIILEAEREIMEALIEEGFLPSSKKDDVEKGANVATREDGVSAPTTEKGADTSSQKDRIAAPPVDGNIDPASQEVNISASPTEGDANTSSQEANVPVSPTEGNTNTSFKEVNISAPSTEGNINPPSQEDGITMPPAENDADMPPQGDDDNIMPENPPELGSFQHPFMDIGMKMQKYNDALGEFQQLGISHVAVLPELVLVGDQSSGKSTLMSALARLNLPASSGVSTRCPLHIRMSSSSHWSVSITRRLFLFC